MTAPQGGGPPPPQPGGAPPQPGGAAQPAAPIGASQATGPTQNLGATAQGNQVAAVLVTIMTAALAKLPPSPLRTAISKAQYEISKQLEPGTASPAGEENAIRTMLVNRQRMAPQMGALRTAQGAPGGAAPAQPPMQAPHAA